MHLFVCTNERENAHPRGCCATKGSLEIMTRLKRAARKAGLKDVRVNKSGCLDKCEFGPSCVVYPEGTWHTLPGDDEGLERILESLKVGPLVEEFVMGE
tara:strand:- start:387 stop:683 length:297 start_codon:yes stop_codon:yes gene_type:complete